MPIRTACIGCRLWVGCSSEPVAACRAVVAGNKKWQAELEMMVETRQKAEIQALSTFGFQYLTQQYLPQKLVRTTLLLLT